MEEKELNNPLNNVSVLKEELNRSNMASLGDSEKIIQHLNEQLQEARELANTEKLKCNELKGLLDEERRERKHQADESANQVKLLQGQLRQLQGEMGVVKEQRDNASSSARDEVRSLQRALEERDREATAIQSSLATVTKDLDKWRQTANKYEHDIGGLQGDLQQQSKQWQKTAEIQAGELQSMQKECNSLQKECSVLHSERQDLLNKHQKDGDRLQGECAALRAEMEALLGSHRREKEALLEDYAELRSERDMLLKKQQQIEKELACSQVQNAELSISLKSLESTQEELEQRLGNLQLQHREDSTKLETQLEEAHGLTKDLQRENEDAKTELSGLKESMKQTEHEKQLIADELQGCQADMKLLRENGSKTSLLLPVQAILIGLILALLFWCFGAVW